MTIHNNNNFHIDHISVEIVWNIGSYLKIDEALNWSQTSSHFKELLSSEDFFKYRLIQNFPLLKTIQKTFVTPFESQIPDFWESVSICLYKGLNSASPLSLKIAASSLKCLPPIFAKMPNKGKSIYLISKNLDSLNWGNSVRYFAHIMKTFQAKLDLESDLKVFKHKKHQYENTQEVSQKAVALNQMYEIVEKHRSHNTPAFSFDAPRSVNMASYIMECANYSSNFSLALIFKRQANLLRSADSELNVEKILMQNWHTSIPNLIPSEAFFEENKKTIVP